MLTSSSEPLSLVKRLSASCIVFSFTKLGAITPYHANIRLRLRLIQGKTLQIALHCVAQKAISPVGK